MIYFVEYNNPKSQKIYTSNYISPLGFGPMIKIKG